MTVVPPRMGQEGPGGARPTLNPPPDGSPLANLPGAPNSLMSMWSNGLMPMVQNQFNAFLFAQAAAAAYLARQQPGPPNQGINTAATSKSPAELVNDVINDLSPLRATSSPQTCPVRTYTCPHVGCGHETRETRDHLHHLRDHHGEKIRIYYCDHCTYASKTVAKVRRHASLIHKIDNHPAIASPVQPDPDHPAVLSDSAGPESPVEAFKCPECKYTTTDPARFRKHQRCHQVYGDTKCSMCDFTTVYAWNLDRHVKSHTTPGRFACFRCSFSQNTRQSMSFHLQHHHIIPKTDAETETEPTEDVWEVMPHDAMGHEVFLFERHAVKMNDGYDSAVAVDTESGSDSPSAVAEVVDSVRKMANATITVSSPIPQATEQTPKKIVSEAEIIESPSEPRDLREYESNDPDIRKRICSICGYQGKWISEMVRHKRVHTNERPFKCKYCSRTSKWKADLIRHVSKAHGIKVVSRYSRGGAADLAMRSTSLKPPSAPIDESLAIDVGESSPPSTTQPLPGNVDVRAALMSQETQLMHAFMQANGGIGFRPPEAPTLRDAQLLEYFRSHGSVSPQAVPTSTSSSDPDHGSNSSMSPVSGPGLSVEQTLEHVGSAEQKSVLEACPQQDAENTAKPYTCSVCPFRSSLSSEVHKHIRLSDAGHGSACVIKSAHCSVIQHTSQPKRSAGSAAWSCSQCGFSNGSRTEVIEHLSKVHALPAYSCPDCSFSSLYRKTCIYHSASVHSREEGQVVENLIESDQSPDSDQAAVPLKKRRLESTEESHACGQCPFVGRTAADLSDHASGHEIPKAPLAYKCVFCPWYSRRKPHIQTHMLLHTNEPDVYMSAVERNLITPMSHADDRMSLVDQPLDLSAKQSCPAPLPVDVKAEPELSPGIVPPGGNLLLGYSELSDVFREFEALLPNAGMTSPIKPTPVRPQVPLVATSPEADEKVSPWALPEDEKPEDLVPRTAEIQKVEVVIDGKQSKVWQCRYCLHTSKRRANVRLHERKHFKRALKGAAYCRCPQCDYQGPRENVLDHMIEEHSDNCHLFGRNGERTKPARKSVPRSLVGINGQLPEASPSTPKPKNHVCGQCPAKFTDRAQLMRHERFHGTDLRYKCHICNYSVPFPINLTKHYKSHHKVGIIVTGNGTRQCAEEPAAAGAEPVEPVPEDSVPEGVPVSSPDALNDSKEESGLLEASGISAEELGVPVGPPDVKTPADPSGPPSQIRDTVITNGPGLACSPGPTKASLDTAALFPETKNMSPSLDIPLSPISDAEPEERLVIDDV